jgi:hypothetical protein
MQGLAMFKIILFKINTMFDKNKEIHKKDIYRLFKEFFYYVNEYWRNVEPKNEAFKRLYESYAKIMNKNIRFDEILNSKKYLFHYLLAKEEKRNPEFFFYKNDKAFKNIYQDFINLLIDSYYFDGFLTYYEFHERVEEIKKRYKKELREIYNDIYNYSYKPRKQFYKEIQQYFVNKFKKEKK